MRLAASAGGSVLFTARRVAHGGRPMLIPLPPRCRARDHMLPQVRQRLADPGACRPLAAIDQHAVLIRPGPPADALQRHLDGPARARECPVLELVAQQRIWRRWRNCKARSFVGFAPGAIACAPCRSQIWISASVFAHVGLCKVRVWASWASCSPCRLFDPAYRRLDGRRANPAGLGLDVGKRPHAQPAGAALAGRLGWPAELLGLGRLAHAARLYRLMIAPCGRCASSAQS